MAILLILTIMAWHIMVTDLIDIGVYSKNRKKGDQQQKENGKISIISKVEFCLLFFLQLVMTRRVQLRV